MLGHGAAMMRWDSGWWWLYGGGLRNAAAVRADINSLVVQVLGLVQLLQVVEPGV